MTTVTVSLRANQASSLTWAQVDGNFTALANQTNANTTAIANIGGAAGGTTANRPAVPTLYQTYVDTSLNITVWCVQVSPPIWNNAFGVAS
jgi:hypothetical protein